VHFQSRGSWKIVFLMAATVHSIGVTFYAIFASGDLQPWAEPDDKKAVWDPMEGAKSPPPDSDKTVVHYFIFLY
jgi:ACS family sodium-dependent inorganic phosphate cotransporter-like MFS transporter 6/7/8